MGARLKWKDGECTALEFTAEEDRCPVCGSHLQICQHEAHCFWTLQGRVGVLSRVKKCGAKNCKGARLRFRSAEARMLAVPNANLGIDVVFEIGEKHLYEKKTFDTIWKELHARGVGVCVRTVQNAYGYYLALCDCQGARSWKVRKRLKRQGGMVLAIDGVQFDRTSPVLYLIREVFTGELLFAERQVRRGEKDLQPFVEQARRLAEELGVPVWGVVSDKEKGLVPAVMAAFKDYPEPGKTVRYQFCQLHYLKQCEAGMDDDLRRLACVVSEVEDRVREVNRVLACKPAGGSEPEETAVLKAASDICIAGQAAANASGRAVSKPPALKRAKGLKAVESACRRALKKGGPQRGGRKAGNRS